MIYFHPWGQFQWLLNVVKKKDWSLLGCISTEERCLSVLEYLNNASISSLNNLFLLIKDPPSNYSDIITKVIHKRVNEYDKLVSLRNRNIITTNLFALSNDIVEHYKNFINIAGENIILDISSFPKRFFFPFVKLLLTNDEIRNLIVTYTTAKKYDDGDLAEDPEPWNHLPLFGPTIFPEVKPKHAIVGIGFIPFGLSKLIKGKYQDTPVSFFFPFPPGPPHIQRSWEFLRLIEKSYSLKKNDTLLRINSIDTSDAFKHINTISNNGTENIILAPYGPKPMSLAFSIYASLTGSPVYYTQPQKYNPNYCSGAEQIFGYCLKYEGNAIYQVN